MASPSRQTTNTIVIPPGEGRRIYSPVALAWYIENLETDDEGTLKSVVGPSILRIGEDIHERDGGDKISDVVLPPGFTELGIRSDRPHSIFHAALLNGSASTLLYRFGKRLYRFKGGIDDPDEVLVSGLSTSPNPRFPDQYVLINDKIIWTNGDDRARVISYDGGIFELGFAKAAATPMISGPTQPDVDEIPQYFPNSVGSLMLSPTVISQVSGFSLVRVLRLTT